MSNLGKDQISLSQTLNIKNINDRQISGVDLNLLGFDIKKDLTENFVLNSFNAHKNRVLFWLTSKKGDFGRKDFAKGGVLYALLGKLNSSTDLQKYEEIIKTSFNLEFSSDLNLVSVKLFPNKTYRKLNIYMTIQDLISGNYFSLSQGVEL